MREFSWLLILTLFSHCSPTPYTRHLIYLSFISYDKKPQCSCIKIIYKNHTIINIIRVACGSANRDPFSAPSWVTKECHLLWLHKNNVLTPLRWIVKKNHPVYVQARRQKRNVITSNQWRRIYGCIYMVGIKLMDRYCIGKQCIICSRPGSCTVIVIINVIYNYLLSRYRTG